MISFSQRQLLQFGGVLFVGLVAGYFLRDIPTGMRPKLPFLPLSCTYNGQTYRNGEGFRSSDGCNSCSCQNGQIACTLMACVAQLPSVENPPLVKRDTSSLLDVPIVLDTTNILEIRTIYDDEENEKLARSGEPSDSIAQDQASWTIQNFRASSNGTLEGTLEMSAKREPNMVVKNDILFLSVAGSRIFSQGDVFSETLSNVKPIIALKSDDQSALFDLSGTFQVPSLYNEERLQLAAVTVDFSWVRIYEKDATFYYQIIYGAEYQLSSDIRFDQFVPEVSRTFNYIHKPLPETAYLPIDGGFDYLTWIRKNILEKQ